MKTEIFIFEIFIILFGVIMLIKNERTYKMRRLVLNAMLAHTKEQIKNGRYEEIIFPCCEPYEKTLWRLTDWGYTKIVPPDVLEKIQPYIDEKRSDKNA